MQSSVRSPCQIICFVLLVISSFTVSTSLTPTAKAGVSDLVYFSPWARRGSERVLDITDTEKEFDWEKIIPTPQLKWVKCYASRECARLEVPLDYGDPHGDKAAVALLKVSAKVPPDSKAYRGPVLFNPGGPGGSGVAAINNRGERYQQLLGKEYDIVGFDPRGVGRTTPVVSVFQTDIEEAYWNAGSPPLPNSTDDAISQAFFRWHLFNNLVEDRSKRVAEYVSTAVVARDMLAITQAQGRQRLQYWGISYGTVLGATFASMFPDRIDRMVIDGVVNFEGYFTGSPNVSLIDTDKVLQFVYDKCSDAGPACPLYANSSALVRQRVDAILTSVKANPVPVINGSDYGLIDFSFLKKTLFMSLSAPFTTFPQLAGVLAALEAGNGQPALRLLRQLQPLPKCDTAPQIGDFKQVNELAVRCGEAQPAPDTIPDVMAWFTASSKLSIFADAWTDQIHMPCSGWKVRAKEIFSGPFKANTSFPLLIIGNTADPVTPLLGAEKAARNFTGSALLTINTPGHTSEAATSLCANNVIRNYFRQGQLPANGTVCQVEDTIFGDKPTDPQNATYAFSK